jgi:hypothetical protein
MSMHRRPLGRARALAALGAVVILAGCVLPWWTVGGGPGEITPRSGNAFESVGIVVFLGALATLALLTLPYARGRPVVGDRWTSYALIAALSWLAFLFRVVDLAVSHYFSFFHEPAEVVTRIPGLWITVIGLVILGRAAFDLWQAPDGR